MSQTIDVEAKRRIQSPLDLDRMAETYKTKNSIYVFTSPSLQTIERNLYYLMANSIEVDLDVKYIRKPYLLAWNQYGNVTLEYLLMYVNGVFCPEEFDMSTVILPTMSAIISISYDSYTKKSNTNKITSIGW
jgi:hypothetical protein